MLKLKHFVQQSWLLIAASFCFGLLIAVTNATLSPRIEQNEKDKLNNLMKDLIVDANSFEIVIEKLEITGPKNKIITTDVYRALDINNNNTGFAFIAVGPGFADKIKLVIALDSVCEKLYGFNVLTSNETPGFGSKIKDEFFSNQFKGAPADKIKLTKTGNAANIDSQIIAITGATVSSQAVVKIFNTYIEQVKEKLHKQGFINNGR